jgi:hypothetical protein
MPTLCIDNAKYDNLQAIQWSTRCFKTASVSEVGVPQIQCKELPLLVPSTPKSCYQESRYANSVHR